jgi:hypothetical protein
MPPERPTTSNAARSRMRLKQSRLEQIPLAVSFGLLKVGQVMGEEYAKRSRDSPYEPYPINEGLPRQFGVLVYVNNQKVQGWSRRGDQPKKPKAARSITKRLSAVCLIGVGWPARINETGTIHMSAHPAFAPARDAVAPHAAQIVQTFTKPKIGTRKGGR